MSKDVRTQALARLAHSRSADAEAALRAELDAAATTLSEPRDGLALSETLEILEVIGFRFPETVVKLASDFLTRLDEQPDQVFLGSEDEDAFSSAWYRDHLSSKALDVALRLRYLETKAVLILLLRESARTRESVRQKARNGLDSIVAYEAIVFFGDKENQRPGIGPSPQAEVLDVLEGMDGTKVQFFFEQIRSLAEKILSPTVSATQWKSDSVSFGFIAVPGIPSAIRVRERAIALLIKLFATAQTVERKISVLGGLMAATRREDRAPKAPDTDSMIQSNTLSVIRFFETTVGTDIALPVVQAIETRAYRIFRDFDDPEISASAQAVENAITENKEFGFYRVLIGFDSVFGSWKSRREDAYDFKKIEEFRKKKAEEYVSDIEAGKSEAWKARILEFANTESEDLATFPIFYHFLREIAARVPPLAFELVTSEARQIDRFLIPLLSGLWNGRHRPRLRSLINSWLEDSQVSERYRFALTKMFLSTDGVDIPILDRLIELAVAAGDISCLRQIAAVCVARFNDDPMGLRCLFLKAAGALAAQGDGGWVFEAWYRPEFKSVVELLNEAEIAQLLDGLVGLPKLDFHAEEVLTLIARKAPRRTLDFLFDRLRASASKDSDYEAIPYEFHRLHEVMSTIPDDAVKASFNLFRADRDDFRYGGARLLQALFPEFSKSFELALERLVETHDRENLEFVLSVVRNYEGEQFLHDLLKAVVASADGDPDVLSDVTSALIATGVVHGEFGFVEAYDQKLREVEAWQEDPREPVRVFAKSLAATIEGAREVERSRANESILLRKHRYRED